MYEKMSEEERQCVICLDDTNDTTGYSLSEKFGCECKNNVHEDCLAYWVKEQVKHYGKRSVTCLVCRSETGVWTDDDDAQKSDFLVNVGLTPEERRLHQAYEDARARRERDIARCMRMSCIGLCVGLLVVFMLSLAGILK